MNILYLRTGAVWDRNTAELLEKMGCILTQTDAPENTVDTIDYRKKLERAIEESHVEAVFALRYFPEVSSICSKMGVKYATWITSVTDRNIYSCTLLNSCNYIFMTNYAQYEEFKDGDFRQLFYLPLGAYIEWADEELEGVKREYQADLLMPCKILQREDLGEHPLSLESPLKDAVKGYLEGCIACQHQLAGLPSMAEQLPPYVWEELTKYFQPKIREDSVETAYHYYDNRFFNPLITIADREIHLGTIKKNSYFKQVWQNNQWSREELLKRSVCSKINLVIAHRNWRSGIPQTAWNVMAAGGFLLSSMQGDYFRLFQDMMPTVYTEEKDMLSKAVYYLNHDQEREALAKELSQAVRSQHTCGKRLEKLLSLIR